MEQNKINKVAQKISEKWEQRKQIIEAKYQRVSDKHELRKKYKGEVAKTATSKLLVAFLFISCTAIEIFTGYITVKSFELAADLGMSPDLTPLITLIGAVVSEVIGFAIYAIKAAKENTSGGIIYDLAM